MRLWQGGELYYNPELLQGFGVANTVGAGGYPNGEAQKSNFPYPRYNTSRIFLRQEIGLGGEREKVEGEYGQLSGEKDVSRVTLQVGKFSVKDLFDGNDYAEDRAARLPQLVDLGLGRLRLSGRPAGAHLGLHGRAQPAALGGARRLLPGRRPAQFQHLRHEPVRARRLHRRAGDALQALRSARRAAAGHVAHQHLLRLLQPGRGARQPRPSVGLTANDTIAQTRQGRTKYGFYLNLQQELTDDIGLFGRFSWNDGRTEISAFTDIDTSFSLGLSIKGTAWKRPDDRIGIAGALNQISGDHSGYLAAGGLGVLVGDGALTYAAENVVETYYAFQLAKGITATADYQFLNNPGYNAVRGPAHFFSGRLSARF